MLYFYPNTIEIISRHINYNLSGGILRRTVQEKISFQNTSEDEIKEIAIEIEHFRSNLRITDQDNKEIIYLTNEKLKDKKELSDMQEKDKNKRKNILWLILNKSIASGAYGAIFLSYVEYARRTNDHAIIEKNEMAYINHRMYKEVIYFDNIEFYDEETLSIFSHWEDSLEINSYDFYYFIDKNKSYLKNFEQESTNIRNNCISFSISNSKRIEMNIYSIFLFYLFIPEKQQLRLIQVLTWFTLLIPFTEFISVLLNNISYLFASLEVETVLILTLAFAETRTRLISHKKLITLALIITGALFIIILELFGLFNFIPELLQRLWVL